MTMLRFGKIKVAKEKFYGAKKPIKNWDIDEYCLKRAYMSKLLKIRIITFKNKNHFVLI